MLRMGRREPIRQINLRVTETLRRKLETAALERQISTNQLMRLLLEDGLDNKAKQQSLEERVRRLEERAQ
jgi:predicted HicB family RNase H-like nuclease